MPIYLRSEKQHAPCHMYNCNYNTIKKKNDTGNHAFFFAIVRTVASNWNSTYQLAFATLQAIGWQKKMHAENRTIAI